MDGAVWAGWTFWRATASCPVRLEQLPARTNHEFHTQLHIQCNLNLHLITTYVYHFHALASDLGFEQKV